VQLPFLGIGNQHLSAHGRYGEVAF